MIKLMFQDVCPSMVGPRHPDFHQSTLEKSWSGQRPISLRLEVGRGLLAITQPALGSQASWPSVLARLILLWVLMNDTCGGSKSVGAWGWQNCPGLEGANRKEAQQEEGSSRMQGPQPGPSQVDFNNGIGAFELWPLTGVTGTIGYKIRFMWLKEVLKIRVNY